MPENKPKVSTRDRALVSILERMVEQLQFQDKLLHELIERQAKFSGTIEDSMFHQDLQRDENDAGIKKLHDSFIRYRSDMLGFVREQDSTRKSVEDTLKQVNKLSYSFEGTGKVVSDIEERLKKHEKSVHDHIAFSNKKWDNLPIMLAETNHSIAELHVEMEKRFKQTSVETKRWLEKQQKDTEHRLLALDSMETALETLLVRTEPPEKNPLLILRVLKSIGRFFRRMFIGLFKIIGSFFGKKLPRMVKKLCFWKKKT